jgi:hypothetical protein
MTLTKQQIIDYIMLAQNLANNDDFAAYIVDLAKIRIEQDRYDTMFMEIRECTCKLARIYNKQSKDDFNIELAYYLCKFFEQKVLKVMGKTILEHHYIKNRELSNTLEKYIRQYETEALQLSGIITLR